LGHNKLITVKVKVKITLFQQEHCKYITITRSNVTSCIFECNLSVLFCEHINLSIHACVHGISVHGRMHELVLTV